MSNRFCPTARTTAPASENPASHDTTRVADFNRLSGDEIERLIALCEAPALLWRHEPAPARAPEPFGMIA
jgi:hypothetical protein